ncbi:MAG TPA: GNAT family N-acetyltransferase [Pseudonocardia sp.]|nr:GNAT family N-acetyltransferase [Pseudonocardia sp.]
MTPVRRLGSDEWALLRDLRLAALRDAPHAFASTHAREAGDTEDAWRERAGAHAWFVAEAGGEAVGLVAGAARDGAAAHVLSMWVHPRHRGRGIGAALVAAVCDWAAARAATQVTLWVADGNDAATRCYARAGFVPTGRRQPLPSDPAVGEELWARTLPPR